MNDTNNAEEQNLDRWVWVDLEMTGLSESDCVILQIAMIITDSNLRVLAEIDLPIWQPESSLQTMIPYVRNMHTKNGLLDRVRTSLYSVGQAEQELMKLLTTHVAYRQGALAGNSMYVDRRFLQKFMPTFESYLHYRQIDVSSLKILSQAWFGAKGKPPKKSSTHTALQDIKDSIEELKFFKDQFFSPRPGQ